MDCHAFRAAHLDLTDDTLAPDARAAALAHRDACPDCARYDCRVRRSVLLVRNLPEMQSPPGFETRLAAGLARQLGLERWRRRRRSIVLRSAAAAASLAILAGGWSMLARRGASSDPPAVASAAPVAPVRAPQVPVFRSDARAATIWGIPLWAAAISIDQTPARFAASGSPPLPTSR